MTKGWARHPGLPKIPSPMVLVCIMGSTWGQSKCPVIVIGLKVRGEEGEVVEEHHRIFKKSTGLSKALLSTFGHVTWSASAACHFKTLRELHQGELSSNWKDIGGEGAGDLSECSMCLSHSTFVYSPELGLLNRINLGYFNHNLEATAKIQIESQKNIALCKLCFTVNKS